MPALAPALADLEAIIRAKSVTENVQGLLDFLHEVSPRIRIDESEISDGAFEVFLEELESRYSLEVTEENGRRLYTPENKPLSYHHVASVGDSSYGTVDIVIFYS